VTLTVLIRGETGTTRTGLEISMTAGEEGVVMEDALTCLMRSRAEEIHVLVYVSWSVRGR
jgi:hypothetical protein